MPAPSPARGSAPTAPRCSRLSRIVSASLTILCDLRPLMSAMNPTPQEFFPAPDRRGPTVARSSSSSRSPGAPQRAAPRSADRSSRRSSSGARERGHSFWRQPSCRLPALAALCRRPTRPRPRRLAPAHLCRGHPGRARYWPPIGTAMLSYGERLTAKWITGRAGAQWAGRCDHSQPQQQKAVFSAHLRSRARSTLSARGTAQAPRALQRRRHRQPRCQSVLCRAGRFHAAVLTVCRALDCEREREAEAADWRAMSSAPAPRNKITGS